MSNGFPTPFPTPMEAYAALPYQYPLIDLQPVVRIPVVGPEPFNTLVVVRGQVHTTTYGVAAGKLHRHKVVVPTNFRLVGFDPRVQSPFEHSTTAAINMIQATDDSAFVSAVDEVGGFFDDQGTWVIIANVADLWDSVYAGSTAYVSSWVLCNEPPLPEGTHRSLIVSKFVPGQHWIVEWQSAATSETDKQFERFLKITQRRRARQSERCGGAKRVSKADRPPIISSPFLAENVPIVFPSKPSPSDEET